jgi:hypothetical protein
MVNILSIGFTDEWTGSGATKAPTLFGSVMDRITAVITCSVSWGTYGASLSFNATSGTITRDDGKSFLSNDGFVNGDTFQVVGTTGAVNDGNFTITAITDTVITIYSVAATAKYKQGQVNLYGTTMILGLDFYFNLIDQQLPATFKSLTDINTVQKQSAGSGAWDSSVTKTLAPSSRSIAWDIGASNTARKTALPGSGNNYSTLFTITHTFDISPYFLPDQLPNLQAAFYNYSGLQYVPPDYFADTKCLSYICQVDCKFLNGSPVVNQTSNTSYPKPIIKFPLGNTGWFNEYLNGGIPEYFWRTTSRTNHTTGLTMMSMDLAQTVDVVVNVGSNSGNFTAASQVLVGHIYCPMDPNDVTNKLTNMGVNYCLDRVLVTCGAGPVNGSAFGTNQQVLTNVFATYVSPTRINVTYRMSYSSFMQSFLQAKDPTNRNYLIWLTVQGPAITTLASTDRNSIIAEAKLMDWNQDDATQFDWLNDIKFFQYPDITTNAYSGIAGAFNMDLILSKSQFAVPVGSVLQNLLIQINAVNSLTGSAFYLEQFALDFTGKFGYNNEICQPTFANREYNLSVNDPRNQIVFERNPANDAQYPLTFAYDLFYPFMFRYEYWRSLVDGYDQAFTCNPVNQWSIYSLAPNWSLQFTVTANVAGPTGYVTQFIRTANIGCGDQTTSNDGFGGAMTMSIATSYYDTVAAAFVDLGGQVIANAITHVKATFIGSFSSFPPNFNAYYGFLAFDVPATGGVAVLDKTTTEQLPLSSSAWTDSVTLTKVNATTITLEADINGPSLPSVLGILLYARLGFKKV